MLFTILETIKLQRLDSNREEFVHYHLVHKLMTILYKKAVLWAVILNESNFKQRNLLWKWNGNPSQGNVRRHFWPIALFSLLNHSSVYVGPWDADLVPRQCLAEEGDHALPHLPGQFLIGLMD